IYAGAVRGDFAEGLRIPGITTQLIFGFVPVVGTMCALRDFEADRRRGDRLGMALNLLGLVPFLGGFPKTAAIIHGVHHVGRAIHQTHRAGPQS
nr:hypothetical protein [Ktedonobacterales bacterium]